MSPRPAIAAALTLLVAWPAQAERLYIHEAPATFGVDGRLIALDTTTLRKEVVASFRYGDRYNGLAMGPGGDLWLISRALGEPLLSLDPRTGDVLTTHPAFYGTSVTFDLSTGALYLSTVFDGYPGQPYTRLYEADLAAGTRTTRMEATNLYGPNLTWSPAYGLHAIDDRSGALWQYDLATGVAAPTVTLPAPITGVVHGSAWSQGDERHYVLGNQGGGVQAVDLDAGAVSPVRGMPSRSRGLAAASAAGGTPEHALLRVAGTCPGPLVLDVSQLTPGGSFAVIRSDRLAPRNVPDGPCRGAEIALDDPTLVGVFPSGSGAAVLTPTVGAGACGQHVQVLDLATCDASTWVTL